MFRIVHQVAAPVELQITLFDLTVMQTPIHQSHIAVDSPEPSICRRTLSNHPGHLSSVLVIRRDEMTRASNDRLAAQPSHIRQTLSPVPPPGEMDETYALYLILAHSHYYQNMTSSKNRKYITHSTVVRGGQSHSHKEYAQKI